MDISLICQCCTATVLHVILRWEHVAAVLMTARRPWSSLLVLWSLYWEEPQLMRQTKGETTTQQIQDLNQCWVAVGPASKTMGQCQPSICFNEQTRDVKPMLGWCWTRVVDDEPTGQVFSSLLFWFILGLVLSQKAVLDILFHYLSIQFRSHAVYFCHYVFWCVQES